MVTPEDELRNRAYQSEVSRIAQQTDPFVGPSYINKYGDPIDTFYAGGSPTFNEMTGRDETYVGRDGTITYGKDTFPDGAPIMDPAKDDIFSYDLDGYGAGYKKGKDRLSKKDLKNLRNQGYSLEDIVNYADAQISDGVTSGDKARRLLERFRDEVQNNGASIDVDAPFEGPIQMPDAPFEGPVQGGPITQPGQKSDAPEFDFSGPITKLPVPGDPDYVDPLPGVEREPKPVSEPVDKTKKGNKGDTRGFEGLLNAGKKKGKKK